MKPTDCWMCEQVFDEDPLLQMQARHAQFKHGNKEAHRVVDNALQGIHDEHAGLFELPPNPIA